MSLLPFWDPGVNVNNTGPRFEPGVWRTFYVFVSSFELSFQHITS